MVGLLYEAYAQYDFTASAREIYFDSTVSVQLYLHWRGRGTEANAAGMADYSQARQ